MAIRTDRPNAGVYRRQLIAMLDDDTADRIEADATFAGEPKAAILRRYIELGIKRHDALERAKGKPERGAAHSQSRIDYAREHTLDGPLDGPAD